MSHSVRDEQATTAREFAEIVARIDDATLERAMADDGTRALVLHGVFGQMPDRLHRERAVGVDAVVHWQVGRRPDVWTVRITDGRCTVTEGLAGTPTVRFDIGNVAFLRLISGQASGMGLILTGKLRLAGSMAFARQVEDLFVTDTGGGARRGLRRRR
ncbi:MAG TPA: SCP2 sterol-binding domain-containing protein [Aldersonia sp.]